MNTCICRVFFLNIFIGWLDLLHIVWILIGYVVLPMVHIDNPVFLLCWHVHFIQLQPNNWCSVEVQYRSARFEAHLPRQIWGDFKLQMVLFCFFFYFVIYFSVSFLFLCFVLFLINQISGAGANICTNLWVVRWYISLDQIILCLPEIYCVIKYNLLYFRIVCNSFDTTFPPLVAN